MAWSSAVLAANEATYLALDKPMLATLPLLGGAVTAQRWVDGITGTFASTDISSTTEPAIMAADGCTHTRTRPADATHSTMALLFECSAGIEFDAIAFLNHTLDSSVCTALTVEVDDASTFSAPSTVLTINPSTLLSSDRRFVQLDLHHTGAVPLRYSGVAYIRIALTFAGGTRPEIGEVALLRRRQLYHKSHNPWDPSAMTADVERFRTASGVIHDTVFHRGCRHVAATFTIPSGAEQTEALGVFTSGGYGTETLAWIDLPNSVPNDIMLLRHSTPGIYGLPFVNWDARTVSFDCLEQGPHFLAEYP